MIKTIVLLITFLTGASVTQPKSQDLKVKNIAKNGMNVSWHFENERIIFELEAPTDGWLTIGFNTSSEMKGSYLLMGRMVNGQAELVEHFTISSGNYKSIESLGGPVTVRDIEGIESENNTVVKFSVPIKPAGKYQRELSIGKEYRMTMAFSREDDFQHHSMMRTSVLITL